MSKISTHHYGCSDARNRGTCDNRLTIRRDVLEESVLVGIKSRLMHPDLVKEFIAEYYREFNRLAASRDADHQETKRQLAKVEREIREMIDAIKSGIRSLSMAAELETLEQQKSALQKNMDRLPAQTVRLHPKLTEIYRQKVESLREALYDEGSRAEAVVILRGLIDEIRLIPMDGKLAIYLVGNLAAILDLCEKKNPGAFAAGVQVTLVAGTRNHLYRTHFRWFRKAA